MAQCSPVGANYPIIEVVKEQGYIDFAGLELLDFGTLEGC